MDAASEAKFRAAQTMSLPAYKGDVAKMTKKVKSPLTVGPRPSSRREGWYDMAKGEDKSMLRKRVTLRPEVYRAILSEAKLRKQDPETVLEDMILKSLSQKSAEALEEMKQNMERMAPLEDDPEAIEAIKNLWVDYPRLSTIDIAEKIGYPYEAVGGAIMLLLRKGELEPRGHISPRPKK